jgi:hypothetical protein
MADWDINKVAPEFAALGITEANFETFRSKRVAPPEPVPVVAYTRTQAAAVADDYYKNGLPAMGLVEWAKKHGLKIGQVQEILRNIKACDAAVVGSAEE